jgi:hypothetical protein
MKKLKTMRRKVIDCHRPTQEQELNALMALVHREKANTRKEVLAELKLNSDSTDTDSSRAYRAVLRDSNDYYRELRPAGEIIENVITLLRKERVRVKQEMLVKYRLSAKSGVEIKTEGRKLEI